MSDQEDAAAAANEQVEEKQTEESPPAEVTDELAAVPSAEGQDDENPNESNENEAKESESAAEMEPTESPVAEPQAEESSETFAEPEDENTEAAEMKTEEIAEPATDENTNNAEEAKDESGAPAEAPVIEETTAEDVAAKGDDAPADVPASEEAHIATEEPVAAEVPVAEESPVEAPVEMGESSEVPVAEEAPAEVPVAEEAPAEVPVAEEAPADAPVAEGESGEAPVAEEAPVAVDASVAEEALVATDVQVAEEAPVATDAPVAEEAPVADAAAPTEEVIKQVEDTMVATEVKALSAEAPNMVAMDEKKTNVNLEATATVKFVLMPSGQVVTLACTLGQNLESLKSHFAQELKMSASLIMMMFDGKNMNDKTTLADLGVGPNGTVQLEMQSADPVNTPLKSYRPRQEYHMPDVITVRVMTDDCEAKDVVVEIERSRTKKPFLGGFRNKNSGVEFHNASAQTMQKPRPPPTAERFCRDTQTCEQRNIRQQTTNTASTQMTGIGVFVSNIEDKLIVPGKYFSADDYWALVLHKVIILQKYYRRWLAKRYVKKLKEDKAKRLEWERQEEMRKKKEKEDRIKRDYARRINPKSKADFDMLVHCLEKWRVEEMERINTTLDGAERKAAMCMLLDQETELLSAVERHKNEANIDNREKKITGFLEKTAAPKKWQGHDGKLTYMDTPYTIRAKELRDIYNSINMKYLTQDERLDVLLTLKHTVKEHDCKLTQEIIELIDREADLLMRGVKEGNLTGLRKRISTLFLQYIKTPTFNPEAAKLLKVPQDPNVLRKNINYCHSCGNYLPSTEFYITSNSRNVGRCRRCQKVDNDGRQREDHTYYKVMLKALRKSEEAMQDGSNICFLIQEHDLRYLVENIWNNQSVLSAWDDLYDLVSVRWDKHQEWSPWNCILLTHDEAEAHKKLFSLEEGYGAVFIHKVTQKHNFARNYFSRLPGMAELLRQKLGGASEMKSGPAVAGHSVPMAGASQKV